MVMSATTRRDVVKKAVLDLGRRSWPLYPQLPGGDGRDPGTVPGPHEATALLGTLAKWLDQFPTANYALATGQRSGIIALQASGVDAEKVLAELQGQHEPLPSAPTIVNARGEKTRLYKLPAGHDVGGEVQLPGLPLVLIGDGAGVLLPPSLGEGDQPLEWRPGPTYAPLAVAPAWLLGLRTARTPNAAREPTTMDAGLKTTGGAAAGDETIPEAKAPAARVELANEAPALPADPMTVLPEEEKAATPDNEPTATAPLTLPVGPTRLRVDQIIIGTRYRQDMGDVAGLAQNISDVGLMHPPVVNRQGVLVAGLRRVTAAQQLGWTEIPVNVIDNLEDALRLLAAECDENQHRQDYTLLEKEALGRAIEEVESRKAKERQRAHGGTAPGRRADTSENSSGVNEGGKARDKVAAALGMSGPTYDKLKAVADAAKADPATFGKIAEEMNATGKVDPAYQNVQKTQQAKGTKKAPPSKKARKGSRRAADTLTILKPKKKGDVKRLSQALSVFLGDDDALELGKYLHPGRPAKGPRQGADLAGIGW